MFILYVITSRYSHFNILFSKHCQRQIPQYELLPSLGVRRLSSVYFSHFNLLLWKPSTKWVGLGCGSIKISILETNEKAKSTFTSRFLRLNHPLAWVLVKWNSNHSVIWLIKYQKQSAKLAGCLMPDEYNFTQAYKMSNSRSSTGLWKRVKIVSTVDYISYSA